MLHNNKNYTFFIVLNFIKLICILKFFEGFNYKNMYYGLNIKYAGPTKSKKIVQKYYRGIVILAVLRINILFFKK